MSRTHSPAISAAAHVEATITRMAAVIIKHARLAGHVTYDDLARAGFTAAEIIEFQDDARARAVRAAPGVLAA